VTLPATRVSVTVFLIAGALASGAPRSGAQRQPLSGAAALAAVYDAIFDARFGEVPRLLDTACGRTRAIEPGASRSTTLPPGDRAPIEACQLLDVIALGWRIQIEPYDKSRDPAFEAQAAAAIDAIEAWTARDSGRAEAWFYLGGAYGARAQWRVLRGERLAAARDGKRIKEALERALQLDPSLHDAWFGIGLYHYYADVAPAAARMLRWLLALPGGDRTRGMQEMLRARQSGQLLAAEADYQLHLIYLWYEKQPERALALLRGLQRAHMHNPLFPRLIAEIESAYLQDHAASLHTWTALAEAARGNRVAEPAMSQLRARLGIATALEQLSETDAALEQIAPIAQAKPAAPAWLVAQAHYQTGQALDRLGHRAAALEAYRAALATAPDDAPLEVGGKTKKAMRVRPDADAALAYRLSLEGWRALERGASSQAAASLRRALALRPDDPVIRYRHARVLDVQGEDLQAIEGYEQVMGAGALTPPTFFAAAAVDAAALYEHQQAPARAIELYRRALDTIGADNRSRAAATRALTRLGAQRADAPSR
jgi:tetratricopeptide (TPR) repeat protein